jgi:hypothetical protein
MFNLKQTQNLDIFEYNPETLKSIVKLGFATPKNTSLLMCILSALVYKYNDLESLDKIAQDIGILEYKIINIDDILVFGVFHIENSMVISIKGTSNLNDFFSDINFFKRCSLGNGIPGCIHSGFYNVLFDNCKKTLEPRIHHILDLINTLGYNDSLYITGHSLGGGIASIVNSYLNCNGYSKMCKYIRLYTFGCPRVGNSVFSKTVPASARITNGSDIITNLPLPFGYRHIEKRDKIGSSKWLWNIEDHRLLNYFSNLL